MPKIYVQEISNSKNAPCRQRGPSRSALHHLAHPASEVPVPCVRLLPSAPRDAPFKPQLNCQLPSFPGQPFQPRDPGRLPPRAFCPPHHTLQHKPKAPLDIPSLTPHTEWGQGKRDAIGFASFSPVLAFPTTKPSFISSREKTTSPFILQSKKHFCWAPEMPVPVLGPGREWKSRDAPCPTGLTAQPGSGEGWWQTCTQSLSHLRSPKTWHGLLKYGRERPRVTEKEGPPSPGT